MAEYLDKSGLTYFWGKTKDKLNLKADKTELPTKTSQLTNDSGYLAQETDPTVPAWAKQETKPAYTATEVGAIPAADADNFAKKSDLTNVYKYKGSVATKDALPTSDLVAGDVYNVEGDNMNYGWTGTAWDPLGSIFSIESISNTEIDAIMA